METEKIKESLWQRGEPVAKGRACGKGDKVRDVDDR